MTFRYASTLGPRYALPLHFSTLEDAQEHHKMVQRLIGGLPGVDSMRVEEFIDGEWVDVDAVV